MGASENLADAGHEPGSSRLLLGEAIVLEASDGSHILFQGKSAGVLAYVAREGPTSRARLAQLLWPDAASARHSLRQVLLGLRTKGHVIEEGDPIMLNPAIDVEQGDGDLLEDEAFSGCPAFEDWLEYVRTADRAARQERLVREAQEHEQAGRLQEALRVAKRALALDPYSEVALRRVMRLAYAVGDRAGALSAFRDFEERLEASLDVSPLPETIALAKSIEEATLERRGRQLRRSIPPTVDRPPLLAGRDEAWSRMEDAWSNGQVIYLSGPPGIGKTRLMHDFAGQKVPRPRWNVFTARPGDRTTPYASQTRAFRAVLDACPGIELTDVMRHELGRLLPEYAEAPPRPMTSQEEKSFFYATLAEVLILSGAWLDCWIADDWQFVDAASLEMANYMFANVTPVATERKGQRAICTFRTHEVGDDFHAFLDDLVRGGIAVHIALESLEPDAVSRMLTSTGVAGAGRLAPAMHRVTGGNPLFIVETMKSMLEAGDEDGMLGDVPRGLPERVAQIFDERFRRLPLMSLRFLQFLAVAQTDASERLVTTALGLDHAAVATILSQLEEARFIEGFGFRHDLVYEAVKRATPPPIRSYLHRRTADALADVSGSPARIVYHYLEAGAKERALEHALDAAAEARVKGAFDEAADTYRWILDEDVDASRRSVAQERLAELERIIG